MQVLVPRIYHAAGKGRRTARPRPSTLCPDTLLFALGPEALTLFVAGEPLEGSVSAWSQCWRLKASRLIRGSDACILNKPFPGISINKSPEKYRYLAGRCLTIISKRRVWPPRNTAGSTVTWVGFDRIDEQPINGKSTA